ncbi:hypothetical protein [Allohahella sp. A8]|uniref:hypothetical protein n=1 Tax=Allohahella sp. A8 TaxID=3141461 RepID=UPI003A7F7F86
MTALEREMMERPLTEVLAKAARAEELEAELLESQTDCEKWRTHFNQRTAERDELQAKLKQAEAKSEELEDELNQEQHARRHWEQCSESHCAEANKLEEKRTNQRAELAKQNAQIRELQAKLKQQESELQAQAKAIQGWKREVTKGFDDISELEAKLKQQDAELVRSRATVKDRSVTIETLSQIIEEQNFLLDKVHSAFNYTDMHTARRMLDERKAQEAQ